MRIETGCELTAFLNALALFAATFQEPCPLNLEAALPSYLHPP